MPRYRFALSDGEELREGSVKAESFAEALTLIGERLPIDAGDRLEIGVTGFPPALFERVQIGPVLDWRPATKLAA